MHPKSPSAALAVAPLTADGVSPVAPDTLHAAAADDRFWFNGGGGGGGGGSGSRGRGLHSFTFQLSLSRV